MTPGMRTLIAATAAAAATTAYVLACGPFLTEYRAIAAIRPAHPDAYARGNVGIVRPRFARRYLVQAYRRFSGLEPLPGLVPSVPAIEPAMKNASDLRPTLSAQWMALRATIPSDPGAVPLDTSDVNRRVGESYQFIQNCLGDAFSSAIRTANARIAQLGVTSPQVRAWARAQDAIFANCKMDPLVLPEPAAAGADALTRADRAYQTAAAYFYATRYDEATQRFRAIAEDTSSPWRPYGRYLAARALIRSGTVPEKPAQGALAEAEVELTRVLADPSASSLHASARGLLDFVGAHLHPAERLTAVSTAMLGSRPVSLQVIADYQWLMDRFVGDTTEYAYGELAARDAIIKSSALNDWVLAMQGSGAGGVDRAIAQWKRGAGTPWLVAALWNVRPDHAEVPALLTAAAAVDRSAPAFATLAFLRVRLLAWRGDTAAARALLATLPTAPQPGFEPETLNLLAAERLMLATSLEEALKSAPRTIVAETDDVTSAPPAAEVAPEPVFDADAEVLFSQRLPLSTLVEAATSTTLPARLRQRVAGAALVRALLLKRYPEAVEAATALHALAPSLQPDLDRFRRATTPEDRHIAGLFLLLRHPGLRAGVTGLDDDQSLKVREPAKTFDHMFRRNWWCSFEPDGSERRKIESGVLTIVYQGDMPSPPFVSAGDRSALDREFTALAATGTAPAYLAREAVKWAVARPSDPDAAEALAHAVEGTRWGCADKTTSAASRAAFQTLHKLFPKSAWATKTKFWY
jgi:hypothetical protein